MISQALQYALERDLVGQSRAARTLLRAITVAASGLEPDRSPLGAYLFVGSSGTGKTHAARSLVTLLHGDTTRLAVVDCVQLTVHREWPDLARQIAPHFRYQTTERGAAMPAMAPLSVLLVEHLEAARPEFVRALLSALETGYLALGDGQRGSLAGCLVLMTSNICAREILEAGRREVGFSPATSDLDEGERAQVYELCATEAEKKWGAGFLGHLDDLVVFHRLREWHLPAILRRMVHELDRSLGRIGVSIELRPAVEAFLVERAARFLQHGAWFLDKVFRRYVLFPVADLVHGGRAPGGATIVVDRDNDERLRFQVAHAADPPGPTPPGRPAVPGSGGAPIAVEWCEAVDVR